MGRPETVVPSRRNQTSAFTELTRRTSRGSFSGERTTPPIIRGPTIIPALISELQKRADAGEALKAAANQETPQSPWKLSNDAEETAQTIISDRTRRFRKMKSTALPIPGRIEESVFFSSPAGLRMGSDFALRARKTAMRKLVPARMAKVEGMPNVSSANPRGAT
jgi:hypothetical protein